MMTRLRPDLARPSLVGLLNEAFGGLEFGRLALGWPVVGGPKYTAVARFFRTDRNALDLIE